MSRTAVAILVAAAFAPSAIAAALLWPEQPQGGGLAAPAAAPEPQRGPARVAAHDRPGEIDVAVEVELEQPPRAGVMFDVDSGEILWKRAAGRRLAIASLTKMMTARLISRRHRPDERVLVSRRAAETHGSKLGVLPIGKKVPLEPLLYGLIMASANDAAVALAQHDAGSVRRFADRMNREARLMGLECSHFTTPSGLKNRGNYSCALDLATLARANLADRRIARIAGTRRASFPFPGRVGSLDLYNNHYFLTRGIAGLPGAEVTGLKTGLTIAAGRCYVTTARLGSRHLGVILLDTPDPFRQVPALLRAGFAAR
jgi:D-alanyl-D-alanine carboxypeptidase (penicillin-binding protein 5/6)